MFQQKHVRFLFISYIIFFYFRYVGEGSPNSDDDDYDPHLHRELPHGTS